MVCKGNWQCSNLINGYLMAGEGFILAVFSNQTGLSFKE